MTSAELVVLLLWLLAPPLVLAGLGLAVAQRRSPRFTPLRGFIAWLLVLALSVIIAVGMVALGPSSIGHHLGVRDDPLPMGSICTLVRGAGVSAGVVVGSSRPVAFEL